MEMETDDDILRKVALGGSMDYSAWPDLLTDILSRIDKIAHNDFPIPSIPPPSTAPPPPEPRFLAPLPSSDPIEPPPQQSGAGTATSASDSQDSSSQDTNKENANPTASSAAPTGSGPHPAAEDDEEEEATEATGGAASPLEPGALPPQITAMLAEIRTTLVDGFPVYPPHTIQRLAELVLAPRQHYRSLPSYLHAVDRVVHVTSGNNIYPLPPAIPDMSAMSLLANGVGSSSRSDSSRNSMAWANASAGAAVGSDEALGGALLTPIPWLQRRANGGSDASASPSPPISEGSAGAQSQGPAGAQASQQRGAQGAAAAAAAASSSSSSSSAAGPSSGSGPGRQFEGQVRTESTETIDGPNGIGSIETVSISFNGIPSMGAARALTQGEILRQEQRAGVVPVSQLARASAAMTATASPLSAAASPLSSSSAGEPTPTSTGSPSPSPEGAELTPSSADEEMPNAGEDLPHARGPEEIGAADTGPQNPTTSPYVVGSGGHVEMRGIDVEAAVGRKAEHAHSSPDPDSSSVSSALSPSPSKREADEDMEVADAPAQKKLKEHEGDDVAAGAGSDEAADGPSEGGEPKKDAEGDIELSDEVPEGNSEPAAEATTDAGSGGQEEETSK